MEHWTTHAARCLGDQRLENGENSNGSGCAPVIKCVPGMYSVILPRTNLNRGIFPEGVVSVALGSSALGQAPQRLIEREE